MTEELKPVETESAKTVIRGSDLSAIVFGGTVYLFVVGCGMLNILAAEGGWNPFHWQGRFWTGVLMIAAPSALTIMAVLPAEMRKKIPDQAVELGIVSLWVAFFWVACGGH
jgi:hypothetical protein